MKPNIYESVTARILADLENGTAPWVKPWTGDCMPYNAVSQRAYSGVNVLLLWATASAAGYDVPGWVTFKQAKELGGHVRKGEHGTGIIYAKQIIKNEGTDEQETFSMMRGYTVFNVAQCEGLPDRLYPRPAEVPEHERIARADRFISAVGATVHHGGGRAFYRISADEIHLPEMGAFKSPADYYATSLHEHGHWTGHKSRLDRDFASFDKHELAMEELVAEMTAAFLGAHLGIPAKLQHSEYIAGWISLLKDRNRAIFTAASKASKAADYLRAFSETAQQEAA